MTKYSFELKLKIVQEYLSGQGGRIFLAQKYHIKNSANIFEWVTAYKKFGKSGLQRKKQNASYSTQTKLNAVNLYLTSEMSYRDIANRLKINNSAQIARWVIDYREKGEVAFSKARGRPRKEPELPQTSVKNNVNDRNQELAKLQNENLNLRMEVEYLKGLRRLRMEQQARENPDLFKTSTDNISSHSNNS